MQGNSGSLFAQYPTPDNTQPQTNNSQSRPRTPSTHQSSQSNTTQIVDSFLSDVPQGVYSEYSTLDSSSPALQDSSDLTPHTPESLLYSPALDSSLGDDLNLRKQLRRSPRILNNRTPQTSEQQSDSTSLRSQESSNNQHINREVSPSNIEEKSTQVSRNLDNHRMEIDSENRDINELRDLITTSNIILDTVHHNSVSHKNHDQIKVTANGNKSFTPLHESELEREHEHENEYPESVDLVISNEISEALLRQSEHYNDMASKISNLKFIKVEPDSEEEIEQFTTLTPGIRRSTRKRNTANYSYPRYSYGGGSSKRSKTRKRSRSFRKGSLPASENVDSERNEEIDEHMHELSPIQSDEEHETNEDAHDMDDNGDVDKNTPDNKSQGNLYLKHDLRSRKIMLESPEAADREETEEEPVVAVVAPSKKATGSKRPAKKSTLKEKSAKKTIKRKPSRTKKSPSEKVTPTTPTTPKIIRKPTRGRGRGRGGSRLKSHDVDYKYSREEKIESEIETIKSNSDDMVNDNSENQIAREFSDVEMDFIQEEIEPNVAFVEEPVSTPKRPKRARKSTKNSISESVPKPTRSTRDRDGSVDAQFNENVV